MIISRISVIRDLTFGEDCSCTAAIKQLTVGTLQEDQSSAHLFTRWRMSTTHFVHQSCWLRFSRPGATNNATVWEIKMLAGQRPPSKMMSLIHKLRLPWRMRQVLDKWNQNIVRIAADRRVLSTPTYITGHDNLDFEIHVLLGKRHVGMTLWSIKSFLHWAGKAYSVVLHDDGSLTDKNIKILNQHLVNSTVIRRADADVLMKEKLVGFPNSYKYRFNRLGSTPSHGGASVFSLKLLDFSLLSNARKMLILDSDVLFFSRPEAIINWVNDPSDNDCLYCFELYVPHRDASNRIIRFEQKPDVPLGFNSGLICFDRSRFDLTTLDEWLGINRELAETVYTFEQRAYNHLVKISGGHRPLPESYSFNYNSHDFVATHFGIKSLFFKNISRVRRALMTSSTAN